MIKNISKKQLTILTYRWAANDNELLICVISCRADKFISNWVYYSSSSCFQQVQTLDNQDVLIPALPTK